MASDPSQRDPRAPAPPPLPPAAPPAATGAQNRWPPGTSPPAARPPLVQTAGRHPKQAKPAPPPRAEPQADTTAESGKSYPDAHRHSWFEGLGTEGIPAWLVSVVFHFVLIILLALVTLPSRTREILNLELAYSETPGDQLESFELSGIELSGEDTEMSFDTLAVEDPLAAPPEVPIDITGLTLTTEIEAPSIGFALTGREAGAKEGLLAAYGGTGGTELAVARGLEWLKRNQQTDGSWRLDKPFADGGLAENRVAATAMALLAFQGAGNTHQNGPHQAVVQKGVRALLKMQDADGNFFSEGIAHHRLYSQAQATIAVCELYGMTQDEKLREPAERALRYCVLVQAPEGGWRYEPKVDSDTSVTGWFVMALQSGRMAGLEVPSTTLDNVSRFLDSVAEDGGSSYKYRPQERPRISMTAEALLCRQYLGWQRNDPRLVRGVQQLLDNPIDFSSINYYYWYYATQVLHHQGGRDWFQWNNVMRDALPAKQVESGREAGSWDPTGDPHDAQGGRLYTTCLCIYMLEVYYRHLPIYKVMR